MYNLSDPAGCSVSCGKSTFSPHHKCSFALVRTLFTRYTLCLRLNAIRDVIVVSQNVAVFFNISTYLWKPRDVIVFHFSVTLDNRLSRFFFADQTIPRAVLRNRQFVQVRFPCRKSKTRHFHGTRFNIFTRCETRNLESCHLRCIQIPGVAKLGDRASWSIINLFETLQDESQILAI